MNQKNHPFLFEERLRSILPQDRLADVLQSFARPRPWTARINTLKMDRNSLLQVLQQRGIAFAEVSWCPDALIFKDIPDIDDLVEQGYLYRQNLSSLLPALILDPQPRECVLDLCAAPGSKTTQISALMKNEGKLVAIEAVRDRFYKLKSVVNLLGAQNVVVKWMDARRFRLPVAGGESEGFDKILVDAPCSTEGRFCLQDPKTFQYWSLRKIKEMAHKQKGLLLSAARLLKAGGSMVYSTCTFAPEENEEVISWVLRKMEGLELVSIQMEHIQMIKTYPALLQWEKKAYDPSVRHCLRVLPDEVMEGFFVAKFRKKGFLA